MLFRSYASVQSSLSAGEGLGQVTAAALTGISNLIGDVKAKFANLADGSLTSDQRTVYQNDVSQLVSQIPTYVSQANSHGHNLLTDDTGTYMPFELGRESLRERCSFRLDLVGRCSFKKKKTS